MNIFWRTDLIEKAKRHAIRQRRRAVASGCDNLQAVFSKINRRLIDKLESIAQAKR